MSIANVVVGSNGLVVSVDSTSRVRKEIVCQRVVGEDEITAKRMIAHASHTHYCELCGTSSLYVQNWYLYKNVMRADEFETALIVHCPMCLTVVVEVFRDSGAIELYSSGQLLWKPVAPGTGAVLGVKRYGAAVVGAVNLEGYKAAYYGVKLLGPNVHNVYGLDAITTALITTPWNSGQAKDRFEIGGRKAVPTNHSVMVDTPAGRFMLMAWSRADLQYLARQTISRVSFARYTFNSIGKNLLNGYEEAVLVDFPVLPSGQVAGITLGITPAALDELVLAHWDRFPFLPKTRNAEEIRRLVQATVAKVCGKGEKALKSLWIV